MASKNWLMASVLFVAVVAPRASVAAQCVGDCDGSQSVTVNEIIKLVNIALGTQAESACPQGVPSGAQVNVALIIQAVNNALNGCQGALPSPTPTRALPSPTPTRTPSYADIAGTWAFTDGNVCFTQTGAQISGYIVVDGSACCSIIDNPLCYFEGTVTGNSFSAKAPNGTFTVKGTVTGEHMSGHYDTTNSFCDGKQQGNFSAGFQSRNTC